MNDIHVVPLAKLRASFYENRKLAEAGSIVYVTYWGRPQFAMVSVADANLIEATRNTPTK